MIDEVGLTPFLVFAGRQKGLVRIPVGEHIACKVNHETMVFDSPSLLMNFFLASVASSRLSFGVKKIDSTVRRAMTSMASLVH